MTRLLAVPVLFIAMIFGGIGYTVLVRNMAAITNRDDHMHNEIGWLMVGFGLSGLALLATLALIGLAVLLVFVFPGEK